MNENQKKILLSPLLIIGSPRSGTTWLQKMLLESSAICGGQESYFYSIFHPAFESVSDYENVRRVGLSTYWTPEAFRMQMHEIWINTFKSLLQAKPTATVLLDKTPFHALYVDNIHNFLPEAKFIHLIRDSRAVTASLLAAGKGWGYYWAPTDTKKAALEWYRHVKSARESKIAKNPSHYLEIYYEDLMQDPFLYINKIMVFAGITCEKEHLDMMISKHHFHLEKLSDCKLPSTHDLALNEPIGFLRKGQVDAWKSDLNWYQKILIWRYTRKLMKECGYGWKGRLAINVNSK